MPSADTRRQPLSQLPRLRAMAVAARCRGGRWTPLSAPGSLSRRRALFREPEGRGAQAPPPHQARPLPGAPVPPLELRIGGVAGALEEERGGKGTLDSVRGKTEIKVCFGIKTCRDSHTQASSKTS